MAIVLLHRDVVFEDDHVAVSGHAYVNCVFRRCTLYIREGQFVLENCSFENCVWHIDMVLADRNRLRELRELMSHLDGSLPSTDASDEIPVNLSVSVSTTSVAIVPPKPPDEKKAPEG